MRLHRPSPLFRELHQAALLARRPVFAETLRACGLPLLGRPLWGLSGVTAGPEFYQPDEEGIVAAIVPAFERSRIVDLVACNFTTRAMRTRRGIAAVIGHEWIEDAFLGNQPLTVYDNALTWLRGGCRGIVVLDWQAAPHLLREVPALNCESPATAQRLTAAFERPRPYPPVLVRKGEEQ